MPITTWMEPPAVKAFGVIHLIFAGLGLMMGLWGIFAPLINRMLVRPGAPGYDTQIKMQHDLQWLTLTNGIFVLALAVLLVISGLKLVRSQPDGVKWSNRYAWASIATKIFSLIATVVWIVPATQRMMNETFKTVGLPAGKAEEGLMSVMKAAMAASGVVSPLLSCLYPALALYFLSRPAVKEWCAARSAAGA